jgi:hypothetical protein
LFLDFTDAVEDDLPVKLDGGIPVQRVDMIRRQPLPSDGEIAAAPRMAVSRSAQVLEKSLRQSRFGIETDALSGLSYFLTAIHFYTKKDSLVYIV